MAAYGRVDDSRHLPADCQEPGSAPKPYTRLSSMGYLYLGGSGAKWLAMLDSGAEGPGFKSQSQLEFLFPDVFLHSREFGNGRSHSRDSWASGNEVYYE